MRHTREIESVKKDEFRSVLGSWDAQKISPVFVRMMIPSKSLNLKNPMPVPLIQNTFGKKIQKSAHTVLAMKTWSKLGPDTKNILELWIWRMFPVCHKDVHFLNSYLREFIQIWYIHPASHGVAADTESFFWIITHKDIESCIFKCTCTFTYPHLHGFVTMFRWNFRWSSAAGQIKNKYRVIYTFCTDES